MTAKVLASLFALVKDKATAAAMSMSDVRLTQREIREHTGVGFTQLKSHLRRLVELEHLIVHGGRGRKGYVYELALPYDANGRGKRKMVGATRRMVGQWSGVGAAHESPRHDGGRSPFSRNGRGDRDRVKGAHGPASYRR